MLLAHTDCPLILYVVQHRPTFLSKNLNFSHFSDLSHAYKPIQLLFPAAKVSIVFV